MKTDIDFWSYLAQFSLESEIFQTKAVQKIKTHILCSVTFSRKSCSLWDNVEKYCRAGQTTDGDMAHALCMMDTLDYRNSLRIYNLHRCFTTTVVVRTHCNVTLNVHFACLVFFSFNFCDCVLGWRQVRQAAILRLEKCGVATWTAEWMDVWGVACRTDRLKSTVPEATLETRERRLTISIGEVDEEHRNSFQNFVLFLGFIESWIALRLVGWLIGVFKLLTALWINYLCYDQYRMLQMVCRQTDRPTDWHADRQTDRNRDRQTVNAVYVVTVRVFVYSSFCAQWIPFLLVSQPRFCRRFAVNTHTDTSFSRSGPDVKCCSLNRCFDLNVCCGLCFCVFCEARTDWLPYCCQYYPPPPTFLLDLIPCLKWM